MKKPVLKLAFLVIKLPGSVISVYFLLEIEFNMLLNHTLVVFIVQSSCLSD